MRAASESRGGEAGTAEVEVEEGRETEDTPAVAAQHRRAENRGRIEDKDKTRGIASPSTCSGKWLKNHTQPSKPELASDTASDRI